MTRPIDREHILQKALVKWVREAVSEPHEFLAFDRSKAAGQFSHLREKARGVRAGTPDTLLLTARLPPVWAELKAGTNKASEQQVDMGQRLVAIGGHWSCLSSVQAYHEWIHGLGVELRANAGFLAMHADASVLSVIARAEEKRGKAPRSYKAPVAKPSAARLRKVGAVREKVLF